MLPEVAGRLRSRAARRITKDGPTGLIVTTTRATVDREMETRCLSLLTDDSQEQTRRVYSYSPTWSTPRPMLTSSLGMPCRRGLALKAKHVLRCRSCTPWPTPCRSAQHVSGATSQPSCR